MSTPTLTSGTTTVSADALYNVSSFSWGEATTTYTKPITWVHSYTPMTTTAPQPTSYVAPITNQTVISQPTLGASGASGASVAWENTVKLAQAMTEIKALKAENEKLKATATEQENLAQKCIDLMKDRADLIEMIARLAVQLEEHTAPPPNRQPKTIHEAISVMFDSPHASRDSIVRAHNLG